LLLGRVTYQGFAQAWPQRTDEESGGVYFNGTRKYVVSTTMSESDATWNNSVLISDNVVDEITKLKQENGPDIVVHGSGKLIQTLLANNLVDRIRLLIYPVVLGEGQRLFEDGTTGKFNLVDTRTFSSGVVGVIYEPVPADAE
jgi:dihydrofolate reductase